MNKIFILFYAVFFIEIPVSYIFFEDSKAFRTLELIQYSLLLTTIIASQFSHNNKLNKWIRINGTVEDIIYSQDEMSIIVTSFIYNDQKYTIEDKHADVFQSVGGKITVYLNPNDVLDSTTGKIADHNIVNNLIAAIIAVTILVIRIFLHPLF